MKRFCLILIIWLIVPIFRVSAIYDPLSVPNNKYGIHLADSNDIPDARGLVNSAGGDWGYITLVIPETDRNTGKWQEIFNSLRRSHLIPIVRLATRLDGATWVKPDPDKIDDWVVFLNSLIWPIENRYVVIFNEPNHANEWGKDINPQNYADVLFSLSTRLKNSSSDYFILPAGFDAAATNTRSTMDMSQYLSQMAAYKKEVFNLIDGWTSHSYPNPAFSSPPTKTGKGSLSSYKWELLFLKELGVDRNFPVFITETGWIHSEGVNPDWSLLTPEQVATYIKEAADTIWNDSQVVAVTPFVFSYQDIPFDHFSWKKLGGLGYYPQYLTYQGIIKNKGQPKQHQNYELIGPFIPSTLVTQSTYYLSALIKNKGQSIIDRNDDYILNVNQTQPIIDLAESHLDFIEPNENGSIGLTLKTLDKTGTFPIVIQLGRKSDLVDISNIELELIDPPKLQIYLKLAFKKDSVISNPVVNIYDQNNHLIHNLKNFSVQTNNILIERLTNIVPGKQYKIEVIASGYFAKSKISSLNKELTNLDLGRLMPFDTDMDGIFTIVDLKNILKMQPKEAIRFIF